MIREIMIGLFAFAACSQPGKSDVPPNGLPGRAAEELPPCHDPIKLRKEATRIVLVTCSGSETEIKFSEITGPKGDGGKDGRDGGPGPKGDSAADEIIIWCHHNPDDHINRTVQMKISEIVKRFGGYNGAQDFPGNCGTTENKCSCDAPVCGNARPAVTHYFGDPSYD